MDDQTAVNPIQSKRDERIKAIQESCDHEGQYRNGGNIMIQSGQDVMVYPILFCKRCGMVFMRRMEIKGMATARVLPVLGRRS